MRIFCVLLITFTGLISAARGEPREWASEWPQTDFSRVSIPFSEIKSGGPPKDGIPAIDNPDFEAASELDLPPTEPVVSVTVRGETRAYPIRYLMWHEIVNDRFGEVPVTVTYCPLCNAAIAFDGRVAGQELTFGVSGKLRKSDMIMYDRQTESWWQQFTGEAIVGEQLGAELGRFPAQMIGWAVFREAHPNAKVMTRPRGHLRDYGRNPYVGYDTLSQPWLYVGEPPPHDIPMMARVVVVGERAWLMENIVAAGSLTQEGLTLSWSKGQASALDAARIGQGRDVGAISVTDAEGAPVVHDVTFAFVFHAFVPDGQWMLSE